MSPSSATAGAGTEAARSLSLAGRIEASDDLVPILTAWTKTLLARNRSRYTVAAYRAVVAAAMREKGWRRKSDLTPAALEEYFVAKRSDKLWKGSTYNRNLTAFRSLTGFMHRPEADPGDPTGGLERAIDDGEEGSRAATLEEIGAMLLQAWAWERSRRAEMSRPVLQLCCYCRHGCRFGEPERLRWKHLAIDETPPRIVWGKDINKNRKHQENVMTEDLAAAFRAHRAAMRELARSTPVIRKVVKGGTVQERPISPDDPEAFVFPALLSRAQFRTLRDDAGVKAADGRGRPFSTHSLRKWFDTALQDAGVPDRMVRRLMRHSVEVADRYYDPKLARQVAALKKLPPLAGCGPVVDNCFGLTPARRSADDESATAMPTTPNSAFSPPIQPPAIPGTLQWQLDFPAWIRGLSAQFTEQSGPGHEAAGGKGGPQFTNPEMPIPGFVNVDSRSGALADFFSALGRLLRPGAGHVDK